MKNTPGPRAPPVRSLPSLKITARSYSYDDYGDDCDDDEVFDDKLKQRTHTESGRVRMLMMMLKMMLKLMVKTWTTLTVMRRETGRVMMMISTEARVMRIAQMLVPSSQPVMSMTMVMLMTMVVG